MNAPPLRSMHLFAGAGGGLLADLILGHQPVCAVEWNPYCCAVLRERSADGWFPGLHVLEGDVRLFDPSPWAGRVDCLHAGFPCQDISLAGEGKGVDGERSGLYREVIRVADVVRPRFIFLENSPAIVDRGLGQVLADLAARGFDGRWTVLASADVGACTERERWWGLFWRGEVSNAVQIPAWEDRAQLGACMQGDQGEVRAQYVPDSQSGGGDGGARHRPSSVSCGPDVGCRINAADWWGSEPPVGRVVTRVANHLHRINAVGNGQDPLCAATAFRLLGGPLT